MELGVSTEVTNNVSQLRRKPHGCKQGSFTRTNCTSGGTLRLAFKHFLNESIEEAGVLPACPSLNAGKHFKDIFVDVYSELVRTCADVDV